MSTEPAATADRVDAAGGPRRARRVVRRVATHRVVRLVLVVLFALGGAMAAVQLFGSVQRSVGPVRASFAVIPSWYGGTEVDIPPLGTLSIASHQGPLHLKVQVRGIDITQARDLVEGGASTDDIEKELTADVRHILVRLVVRDALLALAGAMVVTLVVFRRGRAVLLSAGVALAALAVSGGVAAGTYSARSFTQPRFTGLLSSAPTLVGNLDEIPDKFNSYRRQLVKLVTNVSKLYGVTTSLPGAISTDAIPVLWVSDIHDNPASFSVMQSLIGQYGIKAVFDTGDLSDHGTAAEDRLYTSIADFGVPYVYVRGNHDSTATQAYIASLANGRVLDGGKVLTVAGIRISGTGDPLFTPDKTVQTDDSDAALTTAGRTVADAADAQKKDGTPVDVALVHEPPMATPILGHVPLVLDGHTHKRSHAFADGTIEITQGSSGGAGLRNLEGDQPLPLAMSVLYFDPDDHRLLAADDITISGLGLESVSIQRHRASYYTDTAEDTTPTPSPSGPSGGGGGTQQPADTPEPSDGSGSQPAPTAS